MKILAIILIVWSPLLGLCQQIDSTTNTLKVKASKNVFQDQFGNEVTSEQYFRLANSGLYNISFTKRDSGTIYYLLDSTTLLKSVNRKAPAASYRDLSGLSVAVPKTGKITVMDFWATTCPPCIEEMDSLNNLVKDFPGVEFIAFTAESESVIKAFLQKHTFMYKIIPDSKNIKSSFFVSAYPSHIVCDKNGIIRYVSIGKDLSLRTKIHSTMISE